MSKVKNFILVTGIDLQKVSPFEVAKRVLAEMPRVPFIQILDGISANISSTQMITNILFIKNINFTFKEIKTLGIFNIPVIFVCTATEGEMFFKVREICSKEYNAKMDEATIDFEKIIKGQKELIDSLNRNLALYKDKFLQSEVKQVIETEHFLEFTEWAAENYIRKYGKWFTEHKGELVQVTTSKIYKVFCSE